MPFAHYHLVIQEGFSLVQLPGSGVVSIICQSVFPIACDFGGVEEGLLQNYIYVCVCVYIYMHMYTHTYMFDVTVDSYIVVRNHTERAGCGGSCL